MIVQLYNKEQVRTLFERESVLLGSEDKVPRDRAADIFGVEAVEHTARMDSHGDYYNGYGVGDYTLYALTHRGLQTAASFYNVQQLRPPAGA